MNVRLMRATRRRGLNGAVPAVPSAAGGTGPLRSAKGKALAFLRRSRVTAFSLALVVSLLGPGIAFGAETIPYTSYAAFPSGQQQKEYPHRMVGTLFGTTPDGADFGCTASVFRSDTLSIVATAGHCVKDPNDPLGRWHQNLMFRPAKHYADSPYGAWPAIGLTTTGGWGQNGHTDLDVGFVKLARDANGLAVQDRVGAFGWIFNGARDHHYTTLGYPGGAWGHNYQMVCHSRYGGTRNESVGPDQSMSGCDWVVGGASGSPQVKKFSGHGTCSFCNQVTHIVRGGDSANEFFGNAYLGQEALDAFRDAESM